MIVRWHGMIFVVTMVERLLEKAVLAPSVVTLVILALVDLGFGLLEHLLVLVQIAKQLKYHDVLRSRFQVR